LGRLSVWQYRFLCKSSDRQNIPRLGRRFDFVVLVIASVEVVSGTEGEVVGIPCRNKYQALLFDFT